MKMHTRRRFVAGLGSTLAACCLPLPALAAPQLDRSNGRRVVIVGGGFGGTIAARTIKIADPSVEVVLVTAEDHYLACAGSNLIVAGLRPLAANRIDYRRLATDFGIHLVTGRASAVDAAKKTITVGAQTIAYDRLVLSPGIELRFGEIAGYDPATTPLKMPHAWQAGVQTELLRDQLAAMADGGTFVITVPRGPIRAPAGPYERASLAASLFKAGKPNSRIVVIDENPAMLMKGKLFRSIWESRFPGMIDYRPASTIVGVDAEAMTVKTAAGDVRGDVVNVIPPQAAGAIAQAAGVVGDDGRWCPVDPTTFESRKVPGIHVIGDAAIAAPMPKTGFSANSAAKVCALNLVAAMNDKRLLDPSSANVTYSFVSEREAISVAAVYRVEGEKTVEVPGSGGTSAEPTEIEYLMGIGWLDNILREMST